MNKLTNLQVANNVELYKCGTVTYVNLLREASFHSCKTPGDVVIVRYLEGCVTFIINPNYMYPDIEYTNNKT